MQTMLFILGVIGFTHIMVDSKITEPLREWFKEPYWPPVWPCIRMLFTQPIVWLRTYVISPISSMIGCYQCCGFWCGLAIGWMTLTEANFWQILAAGFAGSFLANSAAIFLNYLEAQTIVRLHDEDKG